MIAPDNPVRVVEAFVEAIDLEKLGFIKVCPHKRGAPAYHPALLLKIYLYGYLNRVRSSRRLELECGRNIELMWLTGCQKTSYHTISDFCFIKPHRKALKAVVCLFNQVLHQAQLFGQELVAVDGIRIRAQNVLRNELLGHYTSGERYATANAIDLRLESRVHATLRTNLYWDFGAQAQTSLGAGLLSYYTTPVDASIIGYEDAIPFNVPNLSVDAFSSNLFSQFAWRGKKLRLLASAAMSSTTYWQSVEVPTRFAGLYRFDSTWSCYANYGIGYRAANGYELSNRFSGYFSGISYERYQRNGDKIPYSSSVHTFEAGVRFTRNQVRVNGSFFQQQAYHLIRSGYLSQRIEGEDRSFSYGYEAAPGRALSMWGLQGLFSSDDQKVEFSLGRRRNFRLRGRTEFFMQYVQGREWFGEPFAPTGEIRNQPRWMAQFRSWTGTDKVEFMAASNLQQSVLSKSVTYADLWERDPSTRISRYQRFRSWDFMLRLYLSKHLVAYCSLQNAFNKQISGLDATGTPEDLNFPIQQGRLWRFGVNYNLGE